MHNFIILWHLLGIFVGCRNAPITREALGDPIITDPEIITLLEASINAHPIDFPDSVIVIGILRVDTTTTDTLWCEQNHCYRKFYAVWGERRIFATERQPGVFHPRSIIVAGYRKEYVMTGAVRWRLIVAN